MDQSEESEHLCNTSYILSLNPSCPRAERVELWVDPCILGAGVMPAGAKDTINRLLANQRTSTAQRLITG